MSYDGCYSFFKGFALYVFVRVIGSGAWCNHERLERADEEGLYYYHHRLMEDFFCLLHILSRLATTCREGIL